MTVLPNGNFVVTDPNGPVSNVGAVYLYNSSGMLISTLMGSHADDRVGKDEAQRSRSKSDESWAYQASLRANFVIPSVSQHGRLASLDQLCRRVRLVSHWPVHPQHLHVEQEVQYDGQQQSAGENSDSTE